MLLTITTTASSALPDAREVGFLLHKNPDSLFERELPFGIARVFWPEATPERATCALAVELDPIGLVRGRPDSLFAYVSDRPYAASSFLSVALAQCFSTALGGRATKHAALVSVPLTLSATLHALACDAGEALVRRLFEPLGWNLEITQLPLDPAFPEWGTGELFTVTLSGNATVHDLLSHLYVLIPVLDNAKHYGIGADEVDKLLRHGEGWLTTHPERELIARRYLRYRHVLTQTALDRLAESDPVADGTDTEETALAEEVLETPVRLNDRRIEAALEAIRSLTPPARSLVDLGCGEGKTLKAIKEGGFGLISIVGVDVSVQALQFAHRRLHLENAPAGGPLTLLHGSLVYLDERLPVAPDVALLMEVIEHLDPWRLATLEEIVFGRLRPRRLVVTTPNADYNALWPSLPAGKFRHNDHRFEWTRAEFAAWAEGVATRHGYKVTYLPVGDIDTTHGAPTQLGLFDKNLEIT